MKKSSPSPSNRLREKLRREFGLRQLVGQSPRFQAQWAKLEAASDCDVTVLITGETGTGKELFGRALHYLSARAGGPFMPVNCGALPPDLVENELFGHERAAFTGAAAASPGLVAGAETGTLFLDEVNSLPAHAQVKLLRFLQEKEYRPLGSTRLHPADVRVVAATSAHPEEDVDAGRLRRDLFYRLNVVRLDLPPLRERPEDIPLLARHFLDLFNRRFDRGVPGFSKAAMQALALHSWPGNVRELEHAVERAVVMSSLGSGPPRLLEPADLVAPGGRSCPAEECFKRAKARAVAEFEQRYIRALLAAHRGNISRAAQAADKDRKSFWLLIQKHAIDVEAFRA